MNNISDSISTHYIKKYMLLLISIIVIFVSYNSLHLSSAGILHYYSILIPALWSVLFIYFFERKYELIAINGYFVFLLLISSDRINVGLLKENDIAIYTLFSICLTIISSYIYQIFSFASRYKISFFICFAIVIAICTIPVMFVIYSLNFDSKVSKEILYAIFQSNSNESFEYITDYISIKWIILCLMVTLFSGVLLYRQEKRRGKHLTLWLLVIAVIAMAFIIKRIPTLPLPHFTVQSYNKYRDELNLFKKIQKQRQTDNIKFEATKRDTGETYIIVIGESLNKKHMGLYGYFRDTTPNLSKMSQKEQLLVFDNVYSSHTHTEQVLKLSLTESNLYNGKNFTNSLSIIEILKQAGVETYWLTNQVIYGAWDNAVSVIATSSDNIVAFNASMGKATSPQKHDAVLIPEVKKILEKKTDKNRLLFVHLYGNHNSYASRYPTDNYSIFERILFQGDFGKMASSNNDISFYDNSVLYNDYVVSSLLSELKKVKGACGFLYISDHADDVIAKKGHSIGNFTYEMTQIPMILWLNDKYKKIYSGKYSSLLKNQTKLFSNDQLYDTIIGMISIKTDKYAPEYDLSSNFYNLEAKDALLISHNRHYTEVGNHIWWQKSNTQYLVDSGQSARIFPHRVNSTGKLHDIWANGFRSFEVDIHYGYKNRDIFQVGHNQGVMGHSLEHFLSTVPYAEIQRIWLDVKNLNENNYELAINRLEELNTIYDLKKKCIIESGNNDLFFRQFAGQGWHTSYYLPTDAVLNLLKENNVEKMRSLAAKIAEQCIEQQLSAVSFDSRLISFVKEHLEPLLASHIVYHCWLGPPLKKDTFSHELGRNTLYQDDRVKTLLVPYKSQFNL